MLICPIIHCFKRKIQTMEQYIKKALERERETNKKMSSPAKRGKKVATDLPDR